jgi:thiol-disulfide isomerase/thioredoxin
MMNPRNVPTRVLWRGWRPLAIVLAVLATLGCSKPGPELELASGERASWSQWSGQWVVINYWAEWCKPCRVEIPELNRLHRDGAESGVVVLGVNFDGVTGDRLQQLIDEFDIEFPVLLDDPGARWGQERPSILPATLIVDPDGNLHEVLVGPQTFESLSEAVGIEPAP